MAALTSGENHPYVPRPIDSKSLVQGWRSGGTNVARVRYPDPASNVGWVCWFSTLQREVFSGNSGFPFPQKPKFDLIVVIVNFSYSVPS